MQKGATVQAQAVAMSIGAGGSGGAVTVGGGDWNRHGRSKSGRAQLRSAAALGARAARSGLDRAGH